MNNNFMKKSIKDFIRSLNNGVYNNLLNENQIKTLKYEITNYSDDLNYCYGIIIGIYIMFLKEK